MSIPYLVLPSKFSKVEYEMWLHSMFSQSIMFNQGPCYPLYAWILYLFSGAMYTLKSLGVKYACHQSYDKKHTLTKYNDQSVEGSTKKVKHNLYFLAE